MKPQPKVQVQAQKSLSEDDQSQQAKGFSGIARSVECFDNQGFRNFKIVTLHLVNGRVVKSEYSDPYASFEAISRMEMANEVSIHHLNNTWKSGETLSK
jgi:hypothetical protein